MANGVLEAAPAPEFPEQTVEITGKKMNTIGDLSSWAGGIANLIGGYMTNRANAKQAQKQMDFQERMSNTAYQRAVADMKAAGLSPMLAYSQGGAHAPQGAQATMQNPVPAATGSAFQAMTTKAMVDNTNTNTDLQKEQANKTSRESDLVEAQTKVAIRDELLRAQQQATSAAEAHKLEADVKRITAEIRNLGLESQLRETWLPTETQASALHRMIAPLTYIRDKAKTQAEYKYHSSEWGQKYGPMMRDAVGAGQVGTSAATILRNIK